MTGRKITLPLEEVLTCEDIRMGLPLKNVIVLLLLRHLMRLLLRYERVKFQWLWLWGLLLILNLTGRSGRSYIRNRISPLHPRCLIIFKYSPADVSSFISIVYTIIQVRQINFSALEKALLRLLLNRLSRSGSLGLLHCNSGSRRHEL